MSWSRRVDVIDPYYRYPLAVRPSLAFPSFIDEVNHLGFPLDFVNPCPLDLFDSFTDLVRVEKSPSHCTYHRIRRRLEPDFPLQYLCDRVSALESKFDRLVTPRIYDSDRKYKLTKEIKASGERKYKLETEIEGRPERKYKWEVELGGTAAERKYKWEAEIEGPARRKYNWMAEIKGEKKDEGRELVNVRKAKEAAAGEKKKRNYKWTAEIKSERENGEVSGTYTVKACNDGDAENPEKEKKGKKEEKSKKKEKTRVLVIEEEDEPDNHGVLVLRKAFAKRTGAVRSRKGKNKELSPIDAALMIQRAFRAYLIRRSKALRALRELAVAKTKLKEIRASFHNFNYRCLIGRDAEERQKFSERIIVLLLSVDAIEGVDVMVRAAKRRMVEELEAMIDRVDPQPEGKNLSMKRRTFDMPDSVIRKEIADGVSQIVQMLETEG